MSELTVSKKFTNVEAYLWKTECPNCEFGHISKAWPMNVEERMESGIIGNLLYAGCDRCGFRCYAYRDKSQEGEVIEYAQREGLRCMICGGSHWVNECPEDATKFEL